MSKKRTAANGTTTNNGPGDLNKDKVKQKMVQKSNGRRPKSAIIKTNLVDQLESHLDQRELLTVLNASAFL